MRRLAWLALLLVACSAQPPAPAGSPQASHSQWSCRLPVIAGSKGQGSGPQQAGFLSLPGTSFSPAKDAGDGMFYDRPLARWVPAGPPALSADGLSYAYADGDTTQTRVHLMDLRTGRDVVLADGGPWRVVGIEPDFVYMLRLEYVSSPAYGMLPVARGLWRVPREGGSPTQLTDDTRDWAWVAAGVAWGDQNTLDAAGGPNDVVRLDLNTRLVTVWFAPGARSRVLAVDVTGVPVVMIEAADYELWSVKLPGGAVKVWSGKPDGLGPYWPLAVDGTVIWLSSRSGTPAWAIYRYSADVGLEQVATFTDHPTSVAGPCA
jgi:hypothetical protein